ncbi:MAG: capsid protein [Pseudomonadota bacterium]|nr:capsid protein [Pseudomonadota bacterium]
MSNGMPFTPSTEQTAIAIAYKNKRLIADIVAPRVPVGKMNFKYTVFNKNDGLTVPDTQIGRKSTANQVEFGSSEETASVVDYGLSAVVPNDDIDNAPANYNPLNHTTESVTDLVLLSREIRVANLYNKASNFGTHTDLAGAGQKHLDNPDFDFLPWLVERMDDMLMRANAMTLSRRVLTKMRSNKHVIKAYNGSLGDSGLVPTQFILDTLELESINVGEAFINTAKKGKAAQLERAWQDNLALTYVDPLANTTNGRMTFAMTAQYGDRVSSNRDVAAGLRGGKEVLVGETVHELAIAKDCGMLFTNALTPA